MHQTNSSSQKDQQPLFRSKKQQSDKQYVQGQVSNLRKTIGHVNNDSDDMEETKQSSR